MFKMTIRLRLLATMAFLGAMLVVGGAMGVFGVRSSNTIMEGIFTNQLPAVDALGANQIALLRARGALDPLLSQTDGTDAAAAIQRAEAYLAQAGQRWANYQKLPVADADKRLNGEVQAARNAYLKEGVEPLLNALKAGDKELAAKLNNGAVAELFAKLADKTDALQAAQVRQAERQFQSSQDAFTWFVWIDILGVAGGMLVVSVSAFFLLRAIAHPLKKLLGQFDAIGSGDLTQQLQANSADEMGQLINGLEKMRRSLAGTVAVVRLSSDSIATSSAEIASGNMDLSARTEQQAASLEETASSMEQLTSTVQQNADHARQANTLALSASDVAARGGAVVGNVVETMNSIKESSSKIVDIIGVIDGIAFQTNILALNAAVEAARAGEQGRGFAVVASEVRSLAQRSANAAKEIASLIGSSVEKVETGTRLVDDAGKTMSEIVTSIRGVAEIMAEITTASAEQSDGIAQVNLAIAKMDESTQQNAALVEEAAAAAGSMREQASRLTQEVSIFKLNQAENHIQQATAEVVPLVHKAAPVAAAPAQPRVKAIARVASAKRTSVVADETWEEY